MPLLLEAPSPRPVIVAFCGYQEHGKSTAAAWLADNHGFVRTSFADPIRRGLIAATGVSEVAFTRANKNTPYEELGGLTPRAAMESLGDWGRSISPLYWARAWDRGLPAHAQIAIDDARYDLETAYALATARRRGADLIVIEIRRPGWQHGTSHGSNRVPSVPEGARFTCVINASTVADMGHEIENQLRESGCL